MTELKLMLIFIQNEPRTKHLLSLYSPGWPGTQGPPVPVSLVLGVLSPPHQHPVRDFTKSYAFPQGQPRISTFFFNMKEQIALH